jgi:hypothetical protein
LALAPEQLRPQQQALRLAPELVLVLVLEQALVLVQQLLRLQQPEQRSTP